MIFFGENISGDAQIAAVIGQLARAQRHSPVSAPLLLMTDQEGGLVRRLPGAPAQSQKQIGESAGGPGRPWRRARRAPGPGRTWPAWA